MILSGTMPHTGVATGPVKLAPSSVLVHREVFASYCEPASPGGTS
jgi:hypothetical protein